MMALLDSNWLYVVIGAITGQIIWHACHSGRISIFFAWYDFWIGMFYDRERRMLYICPVPMVVVKIWFHKP